MTEGPSSTHLQAISKTELTALFIFSAVMFYLIANIFILANKNQNTQTSSPIEIPETVSAHKGHELLEILPKQKDTPTVDSQLEFLTETVDSTNERQPPELIDTKNQVLMQAISTMCKSIDEKLGSVTLEECHSAGLQHSGQVSTNNKPLAYRDFVSTGLTEHGDDNKKRIMLIGGIHGDEFSGVSISFKWLHNLATAYAEQSNTSLSSMHWRVIPLLNPDGLLQPDGQSHRMNANQVDLNRNFPTPDWDELAIKFWKEKRYSDKRRYPGPAAGSEVETQWIVDQINEFNPHAVISIHAPYGIVDADGPTEPPPNVGPLQLKLLGTYPGSMGRYVGVHKNLSMLTVELKHAGIMPSKKDIDHIWVDILKWIDDKVIQRAQEQNAMDSAMQSMRHEINGVTKEIVIDKKAGD